MAPGTFFYGTGVAGNGAPDAEDDKFTRSLEWILKWEGGYVDDPRDPGGATNMGITIGTFTRWRRSRGMPDPTKANLRNITNEEVAAIYRQNYWLRSDADKLDWPLCLAHFDAAVLEGPGRAAQYLRQTRNFERYVDLRLARLTSISGMQWAYRGWTNRMNDLRSEGRS